MKGIKTFFFYANASSNILKETFSGSKKQNYIYLSLIILTIIASIFTYRTSQKKWLFFREAENKYREKSFNEAIMLYQQSLAEGFTRTDALLSLANSYIAIGNFSEGVKFYRLYLDVYPNDLNVRLLFAQALSWDGNIEEAEKEYQKVLEGSYEMESSP